MQDHFNLVGTETGRATAILNDGSLSKVLWLLAAKDQPKMHRGREKSFAVQATHEYDA